MPATLYLSTDSGAPVLNTTAGSLIALLDAVLVNGYGSKPAAGWTKAFSGTNKAAYRNGATAKARSYFRVDDSNAGYATLAGYDQMSDVDSGSYRFPTGTAVYYCHKKAQPWWAYADERTLVLVVQRTTSGVQDKMLTYLGDAVSVAGSSDVGAALLVAGQSSVYDYMIQLGPTMQASGSISSLDSYSRKGPVAGTLSTPVFARTLAAFGQQTVEVGPADAGLGGNVAFLSQTQPSGKWYADYVWHYYYDPGAGSARILGGRLRWVVGFSHPGLDVPGGNIQGTGPWAGKTLYTLGTFNASGSTAAYLWSLGLDLDDNG